MQKHLGNNLHLKLPRSRTLLGCRQSDQGGLAELNGVWAHNLLLKQRDTKQQKLQASQTGLKIYCREVLGTWHRVHADIL